MNERDDPVPVWVTIAHVGFMAWTIVNAHHPEMFIPGMLFFLGFAQVTSPFQNRIDLKPALLVGFFSGRTRDPRRGPGLVDCTGSGEFDRYSADAGGHGVNRL